MTPEAQNALRAQIATMLQDLRAETGADGETMFLLGAGADSLAQMAKAKTWLEFKAAITPADIIQLLQQIDMEGTKLLDDNKLKYAYALQALGMSLAAAGGNEPSLLQGAALLDDVIEETLANYRAYAASKPTVN